MVTLPRPKIANLPMKDLISLVQLINKTKLKTNNLLNVILEPGSKMEQLYEAILTDKVRTDQDAQLLLYGSQTAPAGYSNVKYKLKERLLDSVFLLDYRENGLNTRQRAILEAYKRWAAAMILLMRKEKINAIDQLEKLLRHTMKYEFTELTLEILRVLRLQFSTVDGDLKKYEEIKQLYERYETVWIAESKAEGNYTDIIIQHTLSKATQEQTVVKARQYYNELEPMLQTCDSFKLQLYGRMLLLHVYNGVGDYPTAIKICEEALDFFNSKEYFSALPLQVFYYNLIVYALQMKDFERGQKYVDIMLAVTEEGAFNWFKLQELYFLLAMHTGRYETARAILEKTVQHPNFLEQHVVITEMWTLFNAYLQFLVKVQALPQVSPNSAKFKVAKFNNMVPHFSKDKRGMNMAGLIVQILHGLADKNYDLVADRIEATQKYLTRYAKNRENFRSNTFIKMLLCLSQANFHKEAVLRKSASLSKQLHLCPLSAANQSHEIEIIPFESVWELITQALGVKIIQRKAS